MAARFAPAREVNARGKIIGGVLGFMIGGPIGALIGVYVGHRFDKRRRRRQLASRYSGHSEAVAAAVAALGAKLAKMDGRVSEQEIRAFRAMFHVPARDLPRIAELWREAARTPAGYEPYARHLAQLFADRPAMLRQIFAGLREVVEADRPTGPAQRWALEDVARIFGLGPDWPRLRPAAPFDLGGGELSAATLSATYGNLFDNRVADESRQVFDGGGDLVDTLAKPGVRGVVAASAFLTAAVLMARSGLADGLFPHSELAIAVAAGALAAWAVHALLARRRPLPREAARAAEAAGVAPSEVTSTIDETRTKARALLSAAAGLEPDVRRRVESICDHARRIGEHLLKDPADVARQRPFLMHYLDATGDVVRRFAELSERQGAEAQVAEVRAKLETLLGDIEEMFRSQYERGVKDEARELDVSIDALQRMIRSESGHVR